MRRGWASALVAAVCMPLLSETLHRVPLQVAPARRVPVLRPPPLPRRIHVLSAPRPTRSLATGPVRRASPATDSARRNELRVYRGVEDHAGKYTYIVALLGKRRQRTCTGTLIAPTWVLTAAHCDLGVHIQYGDMTMPMSNITSTREILKIITHPSYRDYNYVSPTYTYNDIAMVLVQKVPLDKFGVLSGIDYRTLIGCEVEYAGLGRTAFKSNKTLDFLKPVSVGTGVVRSCKGLKGHNFPEICVAHKCSWKQSAMRGDSGGPLFLDGKIVGVNAALYLRPTTTICTPVSPYISWIQEVMKNGE